MSVETTSITAVLREFDLVNSENMDFISPCCRPADTFFVISARSGFDWLYFAGYILQKQTDYKQQQCLTGIQQRLVEETTRCKVSTLYATPEAVITI